MARNRKAQSDPSAPDDWRTAVSGSVGDDFSLQALELRPGSPANMMNSSSTIRTELTFPSPPILRLADLCAICELPAHHKERLPIDLRQRYQGRREQYQFDRVCQ